eukprot:scaffold37735_cov80-Skeletonema_marinoi.AAC.1
MEVLRAVHDLRIEVPTTYAPSLRAAASSDFCIVHMYSYTSGQVSTHSLWLNTIHRQAQAGPVTASQLLYHPTQVQPFESSKYRYVKVKGCT